MVTLPKFVVGMLFVVLAVGLWSYFHQASITVILLRAVICAVVLQVGYFLFVVYLFGLESKRRENAGRESPQADSPPHNAKPRSANLR